jgi:hypothetical protein
MGARPLPPDRRSRLRGNDGLCVIQVQLCHPMKQSFSRRIALVRPCLAVFLNKTIFGHFAIFRYSFSKNIAMMMALK